MTSDAAITLESIQIGQTQTYPDGPRGQPWTSAIDKRPIAGPRQVESLGIAGDQQADKRFHGGTDKAVLAYSADHYPGWRVELAADDLEFGGFGENLTLSGLSEETICLGDQWSIGSVVFEISQPRQPCWKVAKLRKQADLVKRIVKTGRSGWYFRVLQPGEIDDGNACVLLERPHPDWTVARASGILHLREGTRTDLLELMALEVLAEAWKKDLM